MMHLPQDTACSIEFKPEPDLAAEDLLLARGCTGISLDRSTPSRNRSPRWAGRGLRSWSGFSLGSPQWLRECSTETGTTISASPPRRVSSRLPMVLGIWDFILENASADWNLHELVRESGKSLRTLEYAFSEMVGRTPSSFIKFHCLQNARRMLFIVGEAGGAVRFENSPGAGFLGRLELPAWTRGAA